MLNEPDVSQNGWAFTIGRNPSQVSRALKDLAKDKLIVEIDGEWAVTKKGRKHVTDAAKRSNDDNEEREDEPCLILFLPSFNMDRHHETLITNKLNRLLGDARNCWDIAQIRCGPLRRNSGHLRSSGFVRCCCNSRISWRKWTATNAILGDARNC